MILYNRIGSFNASIDINRILKTESDGHYRYFAKHKRDVFRREQNMEGKHRGVKYYNGFRTSAVYKHGYKCIWVSYVSNCYADNTINTLRKDLIMSRAGLQARRHRALQQAARYKDCKQFMKLVRKVLPAYGYVEYPYYDPTEFNYKVLYLQLSPRFYKDYWLHTKHRFRELDVLNVVGNKQDGLHGHFIVHRIFKDAKDNNTKYVLRSITHGHIQRGSEAYTFRELILNGFFPVGISSNYHINYLSEYWNNPKHILFLPPTYGFIASKRVTRSVFQRMKLLH